MEQHFSKSSIYSLSIVFGLHQLLQKYSSLELPNVQQLSTNCVCLPFAAERLIISGCLETK